MLTASASGNETGNSTYSKKINGWDALVNYIRANKKIITADSLLQGEEIISFLVYPDGKLSSFNIEESVSPAHDAEILRLIKSGPPLEPLKKKKHRVRINIPFP